MNNYRKAWMKKHGKDEIWMTQASVAGFDVHHMDGDHENDDPNNLVMIYSGDHMLLHRMKKFGGHRNGRWYTEEELDNLKMSKGRRAYFERVNGSRWSDIDVPSALNSAKYYARRMNLEWPIRLTREIAEKMKREAQERRNEKHKERFEKLDAWAEKVRKRRSRDLDM